jgi:hypothetical protein
LAALQPEPIAIPTSAALRHPTSSIPSPVTATDLPMNLRPFTKISFANDESEMLPRCDPNEPYYLCTSKMFEEKLGSNEPFFTWLGAIGMKDPLRAGVTESIKYARNEA